MTDVLLADEEQNEAEQSQCLGHSSTDDEVAHELTLHLRLASSSGAQAVGGDAYTDARADGGQAVTDNLQCGESKSDFHNFLL